MQKTAYEMRISDWSSDVCSSDLGACLERAQLGLGEAVGRLQLLDAGAKLERAELGQNRCAVGAAAGEDRGAAAVREARAQVLQHPLVVVEGGFREDELRLGLRVVDLDQHLVALHRVPGSNSCGASSPSVRSEERRVGKEGVS